jgi:cytochrome c oxidase cbb3-type subunit 2
MLLATFALFGAAFQLLQAGGAGAGLAGPIYAVGISLYSTALVVAPSLLDSTATHLPRRRRAALLYGIAGWLGSALGVGMAQDLHRIPGLFVAAAGSVLFFGWAWTVPRARVLVRMHSVTLLGAVAAVVVFLLVPKPRPTAEALSSSNAIDRGRAVYIAEGCMGCHSQYVRPHHPVDQKLYGPHRPLDRTAAPPLLGLRRQGPDLSNVGSRHDAAWLRHHLQDPRADNPASAMPSYRHLFGDDSGGSRGDDLVAYLESLRPLDSQPTDSQPTDSQPTDSQPTDSP